MSRDCYYDGSGCLVCPELPAVVGQAASYVEQPILGWNAGANSIDMLDGNVHAVFDVPAVTGVVIGLKGSRQQVTIPDLVAHGLYFSSAGTFHAVQVIEGGETKTGAAERALDDVFEIRRLNGVVTYWRNGALLYTSSKVSTGPVLINACMYSTGDALPSGDGTPSASTGTGSARLEAMSLAITASDGSGDDGFTEYPAGSSASGLDVAAAGEDLLANALKGKTTLAPAAGLTYSGYELGLSYSYSGTEAPQFSVIMATEPITSFDGSQPGLITLRTGLSSVTDITQAINLAAGEKVYFAIASTIALTAVGLSVDATVLQVMQPGIPISVVFVSSAQQVRLQLSAAAASFDVAIATSQVTNADVTDGNFFWQLDAYDATFQNYQQNIGYMTLGDVHDGQGNVIGTSTGNPAASFSGLTMPSDDLYLIATFVATMLPTDLVVTITPHEASA